MNLSGSSQIDQARIEWAIRLKFSPFPELDMQMVATQLNSFRIGDLWLIARSWEVMIERDGDLAANIHKRCEDVASLNWEIMSDGSTEGDAHADALKYFYENCFVTEALNQDARGSVGKLIWNATMAHANMYSVHEMLFRVDDAAKRQMTCEFRYMPLWLFENRRGYLGYLRQVYGVYGQPLELGEWFPVVGYGHMRACSVLYVAKQYSTRDWLLYNARYGFPPVHLLTDATQGSKEWNEVIEAWTRLANDGVLISNRGVEAKPIDIAAKAGDNPFRPYVEDVNRIYAKLFRGSDMATGSRASQPGEGKVVGASVQQGEKDILLNADAVWITPVFNFRIDRPVIHYLFGTEPKAWFKLIGPTNDDTQSDLLTAQFCVQNGVSIGVKTARERFNWPEPAAGEPVLQPMAPQMPQDDLGGVKTPAAPSDAMATGAKVRGSQFNAPSTLPNGIKKGANGSNLANGKINGNGNGHAAAPTDAELYAPGARPGPVQLPDMRTPGGGAPLTTWNYPGGQENALGEPDPVQLAPPEKVNNDPGSTTKRFSVAFANDASPKLVSSARRDYAAAVAIPVNVVVQRALECFKPDDPDIVKARCAQFEQWLEKNREHLAADPGAAEALYEAMSAGMANGLAGQNQKDELANEALANYSPDQERDSLGRWVSGGGTLSVRENIARGRKALDRAISQQTDVQKAMHRKEVGRIDFMWGRPGMSAPNEKGATHSDGYGISHIQAKHPEELKQLPETIAKGRVMPHEDENKKYIVHADKLAVLGRKNKSSAYAVTHFSDANKTNELQEKSRPNWLAGK